MIQSFATLKRQKKALLMLAADVVLLPLALWSAFALRLGEFNFQVPHSLWIILLAPVYAIPVFIKMGLYRAIVRYMDDRVVWVVTAGVSEYLGTADDRNRAPASSLGATFSIPDLLGDRRTLCRRKPVCCPRADSWSDAITT